jgi:hypothetical protein
MCRDATYREPGLSINPAHGDDRDQPRTSVSTRQVGKL